jgi:hypothetical protein
MSLLNRERALEGGDSGGRGFRGAEFAQSSPEPLAIAFAMDGAAEFAIPKNAKRTDFFAAV